MGSNPDAKLITLCSRLVEMQAEWQRLYDTTSDGPLLTTPEDHAWNDYSNMVWPGIQIADRVVDKQPNPSDVPGRLLRIRAKTSEGKAAKAAAVLALVEAAGWCGFRSDSLALMHSLLPDVVAEPRSDLARPCA